jgi:anti-sigma regulatory factor (Ser/Thr protein kinase)
MAAITRAVTAARPAGGHHATHGQAPAGDRPQVPSPQVLGTLRIAGERRNVAQARAFVADRLGPDHPCLDVAVLLCSELVTNAVLHTDSGRAGGMVTLVLLRTGDAIQAEVTDDGSVTDPVVKDEVLVPDGHGLFLVEQLADGWGYLRDGRATTVWFRLTA